MTKIYDQAKDKNVAAIIIYGKSGETSSPSAYVDSECTVKYKTSELQDVFLKRAVIQIGPSNYYIPIDFSISNKIGTVTYAKAGSSAGTAATATLSAVAD